MAILGTAADLGCDLNLLLQLGILCLLALGVSYGHRKTPGTVRKHWSTMTAASVLNLAGFAFIMAPSLLSYLDESPIDWRSPWAFMKLLHAVLGILDGLVIISIGALFFANRPRKNMKAWMWVIFTLWMTNIAIGISLYLQMAGVI